MMKPVQSSWITEIGYDPAKRETIVSTKHGQYRVPDMSQADHDAFATSDSIGSHFNTNLKGRACRL